MPALGRRARRASGRGVTLVELLLVMMLLVMAGALVIPPIFGSYATVRLKRAGDTIMAYWAQARAQAIETGAPYQFRFQPETGVYRLEPFTAPSPEEAALAATEPSAKKAAGGAGSSLDESPVIQATLADAVTFHGGEAAVEDPLTSERRVDSLAALETTWSNPILFFPDGSASQAAVVLANDREQYVRLTLRGLTGTARASDILTRGELDRAGRLR